MAHQQPPARRRPSSTPKAGLEGPAKQLLEAKLLELQFGLLSLDEVRRRREDPASSHPPSTHPSIPTKQPATETQLHDAQAWFHPGHFAGVVEELASEGHCGYPLCKKALEGETASTSRPALRPGQKKIDMRRKQVVEVTRVHAMFCSDLCEGAARGYAARLSTEGVFFRAVAQTFLKQQMQGKEAPKPLSPTFVYDMVQKAHGSSSSSSTEQEKEKETEEEASKLEQKEEEQERLPIRPRRRVLPPPVPAKASSSSSSTATTTKPLQPPPKKNEDDRLPLKMGVMEREAPAGPQPLSVWVTQSDAVEGHVVSVGTPILPPPTTPVRQDVLAVEEEEEEEGLEEEEVITGAGEQQEEEEEEGDEDEEFGSPAALAEARTNSVVKENFYLQLWSTLSGWMTPASLQYVGLLAANGGDEKAALAVVHANPTDPLQLQRALIDVQKREGALGSMLVHHVTAAAEALGLGRLVAPSACTSRIKGLLSTFDLYRPLPPFLSSRHYKAMALLFVEATFVSETREEEEEGEKKEGYLQEVGLSMAEYTSLRGDFEVPM